MTRFDRRTLGSKVVAMVLMIAMVGCGSSAHGDVEVEWKCCCHCRRIERDRFRTRRNWRCRRHIAGSYRPARGDGVSLLFLASHVSSNCAGFVLSPIVALLRSELETTMPLRNAG